MAKPGVCTSVQCSSPADFFGLFITQSVKDIIYKETTRSAEQYIAKNREYLDDHIHARGNDWIKHPMRVEDVNPLIAIWIIMGQPTLR
jgi:hypothetical protein